MYPTSSTLPKQLLPGPAPAFLNVDQAATYLGLSPNTLYVWRHRRQGPPSFRMGARVMYRITALDAWIEQQEQSDSRTNTDLSPLNRGAERRNNGTR